MIPKRHPSGTQDGEAYMLLLNRGLRTRHGVCVAFWAARKTELCVLLLRPRVRCVQLVQNASHPLFNLTLTHSRGILNYFYGQTDT